MKRMNYILAAALVFLGSCNVLDLESEVLVLNENAIVDARSAASATNGLYDALQSSALYGGRFIMAHEMLADNARATAFQQFWGELDRGIVPPANAHLEVAYVDAYRAVLTANSILEAVPSLDDLSETEKDEMLGTAYFVRGLMFFDLLRRHGQFWDATSAYGIALPTQVATDIVEIPRSPVADCYEQIGLDLQAAIDRLPDQGNKFYASQGAAQALLARVRLYEGNYAQAATLATAVLTNGAYTLPDDYNEVYTSEGSGEAIFELEFSLQDQNIWADDMYLSPPEVSVSESLVEFWASRPGDTERALYFETIGGLVRCTKYGDAPDADGENTIVLRTSEMYLIRAEALARTGANPADGLPDLNEVRRRAGLADLPPSAAGTLDAFITALLAERRAEFAFEGHYWFDLVRTGRMQSTLGLADFRRALPIPLREMNITDGTLIQNPGYN